MQVVILAGGKATRLGDLTLNRPKSLVLIEGKPFVDYQLKLLKNLGIMDIVICTGHLGEQIEEGFAAAVDRDGDLVLRRVDGSTVSLSAGEVTTQL